MNQQLGLARLDSNLVAALGVDRKYKIIEAVLRSRIVEGFMEEKEKRELEKSEMVIWCESFSFLFVYP